MRASRVRKLIGTVIIVTLVTVYALMTMTLAVRLQLPEMHWSVQLAFFAVGGFLWILPSMLVIRWMSKPD
jgi:hypothetical protein